MARKQINSTSQEPTKLNLSDGVHTITGKIERPYIGVLDGIKMPIQPLNGCTTDADLQLGMILIPAYGVIIFDNDESNNVGESCEWLIAVKGGRVVGGTPAMDREDLQTLDQIREIAGKEKAELKHRHAAWADFNEQNDPDTFESREEAFEDFYGHGNRTTGSNLRQPVAVRVGASSPP